MRQHKLFWGSSYDRGLNHLLKMWPAIKEKYPDASLEVCYGWDLFVNRYANNPERMAWKEGVDKMMKADGITHHGRVGKRELDEITKKCGIWAYPTDFDEINCCSGDTNILMPRDHRVHPYGVPIKELVGKSNFYVYSYDHESDQITLGKVLWVKKTRSNAELLIITLDDGTVLKFTPDHQFMLRDGSYRKASELSVGQSLMPLYERPSFMIKQPNGYWQHEHRIVGELLGDVGGKHVDHINGDRYNNTIDNLQVLSSKDHAKKTFKGRQHSISGKKRLAEMSKERIMNTFPDKESRVEWARAQCRKMWDMVNSMSESDRKKWLTDRANKKRETEKTKKYHNHKIARIDVAAIREDVYDMEVEKYHNFNAGGVFVHNCITALNCQKLGCVPCVINKAALAETVGSGIKVEGDIYDPETRSEFLKQLLILMGDEKLWRREIEKGIKFAASYSWKRIANEWIKEFMAH